MSQQELADKLGYTSRSTINKIEHDANNLRLSKIADFAKVLNTSPGYLMGWDEQPEEYYLDSIAQLINKYDRLNNEGRKQLIDYVDFLLSKEEYKKGTQGQAIS